MELTRKELKGLGDEGGVEGGKGVSWWASTVVILSAARTGGLLG